MSARVQKLPLEYRDVFKRLAMQAIFFFLVVSIKNSMHPRATTQWRKIMVDGSHYIPIHAC